MSAESELWAVVVAAGGSNRLGRPKQALELNGLTLLERAVTAAQEVVGDRVVCVLGAWQPPTPLPCLTVLHERWRDGMASSLVAGLQEVPSAASTLITLCDQPAVGAEQLEKLLRAHRRQPASIVAADYGDRAGVPAVFPAHLRERLLSLSGDRGARDLLSDATLTQLRIPMPEALLDIDTPGDWARLTGDA
ncbi:MAG: nucleotidyltransferase family protein [Pseudomonadota bacterium]